jgi:hypothetical protein
MAKLFRLARRENGHVKRADAWRIIRAAATVVAVIMLWFLAGCISMDARRQQARIHEVIADVQCARRPRPQLEEADCFWSIRGINWDQDWNEMTGQAYRGRANRTLPSGVRLVVVYLDLCQVYRPFWRFLSGEDPKVRYLKWWLVVIREYGQPMRREVVWVSSAHSGAMQPVPPSIQVGADGCAVLLVAKTVKLGAPVEPSVALATPTGAEMPNMAKPYIKVMLDETGHVVAVVHGETLAGFKADGHGSPSGPLVPPVGAVGAQRPVDGSEGRKKAEDGDDEARKGLGLE